MAGLSYARAEWRIALRRPRTFALNIVVPAGLIALLVFSRAPAFHASVVATVLFTFFGTFGSAIPLVRDLETGRLSRLFQAGAPPNLILIQRAIATALLDGVQLSAAAAILVLTHNTAAIIPVLASLLAVLVFCNVFGTWIGALTRSLGEAALLSSVGTLLLLHAAGVFRTPVPNSLADTIQALSPFHYLHSAVQVAFGLTSSQVAVAPLILTVGIALASLLLLPRFTRVVTRTVRR